MSGHRIRVRGLVQGVGFRPHVWRLAQRHGLRGDVCNDGQGVLIHLWGAALDAFLVDLREEAPALAWIAAVEVTPFAGAPPTGFEIVRSAHGVVATTIVPDAATCPDCLRELFDPTDRRHRYAFTNCTNCGPRLSILRAIPYDRARTSMSVFPMCAACAAEYADPADRRFHAEPNACPDCGPRVWLEDAAGRVLEGEPITRTAELLRAGKIVAIKGLGGFHLACDATNAETVAELRRRKHRPDKPLALMARDVAQIAAYAVVEPELSAVLRAPAAPIILLDHNGTLPKSLAPGQNALGWMLPNTPLHHLLLHELSSPIVLTSGNASGQPQCIDNDEARARLAGIADAWLLHDREILNRLDDSVVRFAAGKPRLLRRARGYAPAPLTLHRDFAVAPDVLAMGGELKATFCLLQQGRAVVSQHLGDLEDAATAAEYRHALALYRQMFGFTPTLIAVDGHPDYLATQHGHALAAEAGVPVEVVAHHHAHVAAVLGEHGFGLKAPPVLGVVLDGLGVGADGALWGGEFLLADYRTAERLAHFPAVALPGGARAMREPWRNALAHLHAAFGWEKVAAAWGDLPAIAKLAQKQPRVLVRMIESGLNAPKASSAGRLFDAAAFLLGLCDETISFEGQAAMGLEALAERSSLRAIASPASPCHDGWAWLWRDLLTDLRHNFDPADIAARFHHSVCAAILASIDRLRETHAFSHVALCGGVMQNRILREILSENIAQRGLTLLLPAQIPANDGGLSLGQALIAAVRQFTR